MLYMLLIFFYFANSKSAIELFISRTKENMLRTIKVLL